VRLSDTMMKNTFAVVCLFLLCATVSAVHAAEGGGENPKMIVLGFDGVDAELTEQWMDEGHLPNLARLREQGTFSPLLPTNPSQTPVSWSTFATGLHPGRHTVIDFLKRDPANYIPTLGIVETGREPFLWGERTPWILAILVGLGLAVLFLILLKLFRVGLKPAMVTALVLGIAAGVGVNVAAARLLPKEVPTVENRRQGATFWEILGEAGKKVKVIRVPVTFPPEPFEHGEMVSGLPTPDLSTRLLKPYYFTSELFFTPAAKGDFSIEVVELIDNRGEIPTEVEGPPNELFPNPEPGKTDYLVLPMTLTVADDASHLGIEVSGNQLQLKPGEWSDWVSFTFSYNALLKVHGLGRFRLISLEPEVRLYLSPINFDPKKLPPILNISSPREWAGELADAHGMFKTLGWAVDTNSTSDGAIDETVFMEDAMRTADEYERLLFGILDEDSDWDMLVHYFEFTDRVQHIMFRHFDPEHPMYRPEAGERWGGTILETYQRMDQIIGGVMERMEEGTTLFVASDHGFTSFRYAVNYNTWLAKNGYIKLEGEAPDRYNLEDLFEKGDFFVNVDWSQTRAYALGFGNIYINLAGREGKGIVQPGAEYDQLVAEIKEGLEAYVDPLTEEKPVRYVFTRDEAYGTYDPDYTPDLLATTVDGYRTGWQDTLGGIGASVVEVNNRIWSGDHCGVYPELVKGILFSSRALTPDKPYMGDLMPTFLEAFGVEPAADLDGKSFWR